MSVRILRGISGAGKSSWVENHRRLLESSGREILVFSADHFFMKSGVYRFNPSKLSEAHDSCLREYTGYIQRATLRDKDASIIVDNTNTTVAEIAPYYQLAQAYGHKDVKILTIQADPKICAGRNVHGLSLDAITKQHGRLLREQLSFPDRWKHEFVNQ